ncbi:MAG TPA: response regulator transcription factor [Coriobacteriia bacterium]|nr:response regulator transcription factor [Coriobacteriia bacterium]
MTIRVVLADDHRLMREGLKLQLLRIEDVEVVGEAADGEEAVSLTEALRPDLVLMDIGMPVLNGMEATRQIVERVPESRVIVLSGHSEQRFVTEALQAGAAGYVLKDAEFDELAQAVDAVAAGGVFLSPSVQAAIVDEFAGREPRMRGVSPRSLTAREREVLQLIAEGLTTKQVASKLGLSVKTVETHRRQVMEKTNANSVADLVRYAIREGIATLEQ